MSDSYEKKKPYGKTAVLGVAAAGLYGALLFNQDIINSYFARGGVFAILPIITAFIFSFIHGSFTGNFWTSLGIEAKQENIYKNMTVVAGGGGQLAQVRPPGVKWS